MVFERSFFLMAASVLHYVSTYRTARPGLQFAAVREAYGASNASLDARTRLPPKPAWAD